MNRKYEDFVKLFNKKYNHIYHILYCNIDDEIKKIFDDGVRYAIINKYHRNTIHGVAYRFLLTGKIDRTDDLLIDL